MFVVLEALDAAGKSTLLNKLQTEFGDELFTTEEPSDNCYMGRYIRKILNKEIEATPRQLASAYAQNRGDHLRSVIEPNLFRRKIVLCSRFIISSLVYQTLAGVDRNEVLKMNSGFRTPDITIFLDTPVETCLARLKERGKKEIFDEKLSDQRLLFIHELMGLKRNGGLVRIVDGDRPIGEVVHDTARIIRNGS